MTGEESKGGRSYKGLVIGGVAAALIAGSVVAEHKYNVMDRVRHGIYGAKEAIVETVTTNPYEARDELIESIEKYSDEIKSGEYDLGQIVDQINDLRSKKEVVQDSVDYLTDTDNGMYDLTQYELGRNEASKERGMLADAAYNAMNAEEKTGFISDKGSSLSPEGRIESVLNISDDFRAQDYEKVIPEMFNNSGEKYDNQFSIFRELMKDKTEGLREYFNQGIEKGRELYQKGKDKLLN